jgi:pimeloyl-ACP methyl ester carboxylesterase
MTSSTSPNKHVDTLRGSTALAVQGVQAITDLAQELHGAIASLALPLAGKHHTPKTARGISGLVYRSVRGVAGTVGWGLDHGLKAAQHPMLAKALAPVIERLPAKLNGSSAQRYREAVRSAVNGVLGDALAASHNPLAIPMQLRQHGEALQALPSNGKILILVHGLCMNDLQWRRGGHDHGAMLAAALGFEALYLRYNTGRSIHQNGAEFAALLAVALAHWPVPITQLVIVGHSMGGLIARSACHHALQTKQGWVQHLDKLITLGSPHAGAPLERTGRGIDRLLAISPYTAPFARLGLVRSAGIQNLRHGALTPTGETPRWPKHAKLYLLAGTKQNAAGPQSIWTGPVKRLIGDGLVPVKSALAQEEKPALGLPLKVPASRRALVHQTDHFQLLSSPAVADQLLRWLKA